MKQSMGQEAFVRPTLGALRYILFGRAWFTGAWIVAIATSVYALQTGAFANLFDGDGAAEGGGDGVKGVGDLPADPEELQRRREYGGIGWKYDMGSGQFISPDEQKLSDPSNPQPRIGEYQDVPYPDEVSAQQNAKSGGSNTVGAVLAGGVLALGGVVAGVAIGRRRQ